MRALVIEKDLTITIGKSFNYQGEYFHHLVGVARAKEGEQLLLLNGLGEKWFSEILSINKKSIEILPKSKESIAFKKREVAFCLVKKDSLEPILRSIVEMGCSHVTILYSDFSQRYQLNLDRIQKILNSAMMQSNNCYRPKITIEKSFTGFISEKCRDLITLSSSSSVPLDKWKHGGKEKILLVGPEGGFSSKEEALMDEMNVLKIKFNLPILKTSTAIAFGMGHIFNC